MSELTDFHVFWGAAMAVAEKKSASMESEGPRISPDAFTMNTLSKARQKTKRNG